MTPEKLHDRSLDKCQRHFEAGHKSALLETIFYCACLGIPLPQWAKQAFEAARGRARDGELGSWDEVFGKPWGEGRRKAQWMKMRGSKIWLAVTALRLEKIKIEDAFAKVAAEKNMTVPTVRRLYYDMDRLFEKLGFPRFSNRQSF